MEKVIRCLEKVILLPFGIEQNIQKSTFSLIKHSGTRVIYGKGIVLQSWSSPIYVYLSLRKVQL